MNPNKFLYRFVKGRALPAIITAGFIASSAIALSSPVASATNSGGSGVAAAPSHSVNPEYASFVSTNMSQFYATGVLYVQCATFRVTAGSSNAAAFPTCAINVKANISAAAARYLGLASPTIASGIAKGPGNIDIDGQLQKQIYTISVPALVRQRLRVKQVVTMSFSFTGTAKYLTGEGEYTQKLSDASANLFQGAYYGCFPVGSISIGYWASGGTCPKAP